MAGALKVSLTLALAASQVTAEKGCYRVQQTMEQWTTKYPTNLPSQPHYSQMVLTMHNSKYKMSAVGEHASTGLELLAESGDTNDIVLEIARDANALMPYRGIPILQSGVTEAVVNNVQENKKRGFADFTMEADSKFPEISAATMIAPSPDWYAFGTTTGLYKDGAFQPATIEMYAYDAGTDSGATYTAPNSETRPQGKVTELASGIEGTDTGKRHMMTLKLTPVCCVTASQVMEQWTTMYEDNMAAINAVNTPHYSSMVATAFGAANPIHTLGQTASTGLQNLAESGNPAVLVAEIKTAGGNGFEPSEGAVVLPPIRSTLPAQGMQGNRGFADFRLVLSEAQPKVAFATMIAPSPDWYAAGEGSPFVSSTYSSGIASPPTDIPLYAYDAGTDAGASYLPAGGDMPETTKKAVSEITDSLRISGVKAPLSGKKHMMTIRLTPDPTCDRVTGVTSKAATSLSLGLVTFLAAAFACNARP